MISVLEPEQIARDVLATLSSKMHSRDPTVIDEFSNEADVTLVGSDVGEIIRGKAALFDFFRAAFEWPVRIKWQWSTVDAAVQLGVLWLFADGVVILSSVDGDDQRPYRLGGVLSLEDGMWRWRLFHGSEPVPKA
jgi:hypothetical protein